jgi:hypothetical protein
VDVPGGGDLTVKASSRAMKKTKTKAAAALPVSVKRVPRANGSVKVRLVLSSKVRSAVRKGALIVRATATYVGGGVDLTDATSFVISLGRKK